MLKQIAYKFSRVSEQRQQVYVVGDLESLSATALYYGSRGSPLGNLGSFGIVKTPLMKISAPKVGMTLPGGLTIKDITKNSVVLQEDFGGVGNIYTAHPDGGGATRFYGNETINGITRGKDRETKESWLRGMEELDKFLGRKP